MEPIKAKFRNINEKTTEYVREHRGTIAAVSTFAATATIFGLALRGQSRTFNAYLGDRELFEDYGEWVMQDIIAEMQD